MSSTTHGSEAHRHESAAGLAAILEGDLTRILDEEFTRAVQLRDTPGKEHRARAARPVSSFEALAFSADTEQMLLAAERALSMSAGAQLASPSAPEDRGVAYRVFDMDAVKAPGATYKSVICKQDTSSSDLIQQVLDRFGSDEHPQMFELRYAVDEPDADVKKKKKAKAKDAEPAKVLHHADCPALVADWFCDKPRRFELHRRGDGANTEKRNKKWSEYWSSPMKGKGKTTSMMGSIKRKGTLRRKSKPAAERDMITG